MKNQQEKFYQNDKKDIREDILKEVVTEYKKNLSDQIDKSEEEIVKGLGVSNLEDFNLIHNSMKSLKKKIIGNKHIGKLLIALAVYSTPQTSIARNMESDSHKNSPIEKTIESSDDGFSHDAYNASHDFEKTREKEDKEKGDEDREKIIKSIDLDGNFELGIGTLDNISKESIESKVNSFIENLSDDELNALIKGDIILKAHGESSIEPVNKETGLLMEDGTHIKDNKELAEYRAKEPIKIILENLVKKGFDINNIRIQISTPKTGVSEKNKRFVRLELKLLEEKTTENVLGVLKTNLIAGIEDTSGSINKEEEKKIDAFLSDLEKNDSEFKRIQLEGGNLEAHYSTLEHLFYRSEGFKEQVGDIYIATDERDASNFYSTKVMENYAPRMEALMNKYKDTGKRVFVQIFNPDKDGDFKIISLTDNPLALQIKAKDKKEYRAAAESSKGADRWYSSLEDVSNDILNSVSLNDEIYSISPQEILN